MKTTQILAALALAVTGSLAVSAQAAQPDQATRAEVKADAATARASGQLDPALSYETAPHVDHKKAPNGELTRAEVRQETREYLRAHPNRVADEYQPFNGNND